MIDQMLAYMWTFIGSTPYKLGANVIQDGGLDCSAYMLEGLRSIGKWGKTDARAIDIYNASPRLGKIIPIGSKFLRGDILFYGSSVSDITHVNCVWNETQIIEAGGNDKDGMVRVRPITWRKDLVAILRLS